MPSQRSPAVEMGTRFSIMVYIVFNMYEFKKVSIKYNFESLKINNLTVKNTILIFLLPNSFILSSIISNVQT